MDERREPRRWTLRVKWQNSCKYIGALLMRQRHTKVPIGDELRDREPVQNIPIHSRNTSRRENKIEGSAIIKAKNDKRVDKL